MTKQYCWACIAAALLFPACTGPTDSGEQSWVQASLMSAEGERTFAGDGQFYVSGPDPQYGVDIKFQVTSRGTGQSAGERLYIARMGSGRPGPGVYDIEPLRLIDSAWLGTRVLYTRDAEGTIREGYVARAGELRITRSSHESVEGTFSFVAEIYCRMILTQTPPELPGYACNPRQPHIGEAPLVFEGSFAVVLGGWTPITDDS